MSDNVSFQFFVKAFQFQSELFFLTAQMCHKYTEKNSNLVACCQLMLFPFISVVIQILSVSAVFVVHMRTCLLVKSRLQNLATHVRGQEIGFQQEKSGFYYPLPRLRKSDFLFT